MSPCPWVSVGSRKRVRSRAELHATKEVAPECWNCSTADGVAVGSSYPMGRGEIVLVDRLSSSDKTLAAAFAGRGLLRISKNDARLDAVVRRAPNDADRAIVFVANPSAEPIDANIGLDTPFKSVTEIWSNRSIRPHGQGWADKLPAYSINIYECTN